ncbi:GGDEF domain-containing protein [Chitinilyticum litopenaei]|uniref:GGDEF domain-containing protein n=1 Tax=Chitinilyticum litopenaei TaxID=1121276 RepID=UPI00041BA6DC|nr:GGDEF domain-containing protein [Chitinilyticum litopenaei]
MGRFGNGNAASALYAPATLLTLSDHLPAVSEAGGRHLHPGRLHVRHQRIAAWLAAGLSCLLLPLLFVLQAPVAMPVLLGVPLLAAAFVLIAFGLQGVHQQALLWVHRLLIALAVPWLIYGLQPEPVPVPAPVVLLWPILGLWLLAVTTSPGQWLLCLLVALPALLALLPAWDAPALLVVVAAFALSCLLFLALAVQLAQLRQRVWRIRQRVAEKEADLMARADKMRKLALQDALTGLSNRLHLMSRLKRLMRDDRRVREGATLFLIDLDLFKEVNDRYGHDAGDAVLLEVARRLRRLVRREDTVCRLGGDEFVLLIEGQLQQEFAEHLARKILASLAEPCPYGEHLLPVGGSLGIAAWQPGFADPDDWLKAADVAMYEAKHGDRGSFAFYSDTKSAL